MSGNKERLQKMNQFLVKTIEEFSSLSVSEDSLSTNRLKEIEEETGGKNYFIYETGGFRKTAQESELQQVVLVRFYSENRDDLDEFSLGLIAELEGKLYTFQYSNKTAIQLGKEDQFVDEIEFYFLRRFLNVC